MKFINELHPTSSFPKNSQKLYSIAYKKTNKLWSLLHEFIVQVGQAQLIRRQIANELNFQSKLESKILCKSLANFNKSLINDVQQHYKTPDQHSYPGNPTLPYISNYLESSGISNPITKIYITTEPIEHIACLLFLYVIHYTQKLTWQSSLNTLTNTNNSINLDGAPFVVGVITLLKQFHSSYTHTFLDYLGQYIRSTISTSIKIDPDSSTKKDLTLPIQVRKVICFLSEFCRFSSISRESIKGVPSYIFDHIH